MGFILVYQNIYIFKNKIINLFIKGKLQNKSKFSKGVANQLRLRSHDLVHVF